LDKAFIGVAGISLNLGFTLYSMNDTLVKRALIERAREVIILTDSSKFGVTRYAFFTPIESADTIITDEGISDEDVAALESKGIRVLIAKNDESTSYSGMVEEQTNLE
jgi:DeoR/GlpR family transcriptional regulator of sugar metabolism